MPRLQAVLLVALLRAQAALSSSSSAHRGEPAAQRPLVMEDGCAAACKRAGGLRTTTASRIEECLRANCGAVAEWEGEEDDDEEDEDFAADAVSSCKAGCDRLRLTERGQRRCRRECRREEKEERSGSGPSFGTDSGEGDLPGKDAACVDRCKRLRFGPERRDQCIARCDRAEDGPREGSGGLYEEEEGAEENGGADFPTGDGAACVAHCKRLRFGPERRDQCIARCDRDEDGGPRGQSSGGFEENGAGSGSSSGAAYPGKDGPVNPCVARCMKLRFSVDRRSDCVRKCPTDDFYARAS